MADQDFELDVFRDLLEEAGAIGQLAKGEKSFVAAYEAFRAEDRKAFQAVLKRLKLVPKCHLVCEWIRIKECLLLCLKLCGPPKPVEKPPNPRVLAEAIVRITSDENLVRQLVQILQKRDRAGFQRFVKAQKLEAICHLFCHWVCYVRYRLVCRWVCDLELTKRPDLVAELSAAGAALRALLEKRQVFNDAVSASQAGDAGKFRSVIEAGGLIPFCHFICFFFCSWRCVLVCLTLCRKFPLEPIRDEIREAFEFAKAMQQLRRQPAQLERLSAAVGAGDAKTYAAIVTDLKLQRFCIQLCHWLCFLRCRRFCILICPDDPPLFTHVGDFAIYADIDASGRTNKAKGIGPHGGPNFGFFDCLPLRGWCPKKYLGEQMAYRFLFQQTGQPTPTPITGGFVCDGLVIGSRHTQWGPNPNATQSVSIKGSGSTSPTPPPFDGSLTPPEHYIVPDPNGWIPVDLNALDDGFNFFLMSFASAVAFPGGDPAPGVPAGTAVPVANQKNGPSPHPAIIFEATRISKIGAPPPDFTNQLSNIHINNWIEVGLLDLQEFLGPGKTCCSPLATDLHVLYTTDHELMAEWFIDMVTCPPGPSPFPTFPSGTGPRGGNGSDFHDISTWPVCSYLIRLFTRRSLTTGLIDDDLDNSAFKTFCIGPR